MIADCLTQEERDDIIDALFDHSDVWFMADELDEASHGDKYARRTLIRNFLEEAYNELIDWSSNL